MDHNLDELSRKLSAYDQYPKCVPGSYVNLPRTKYVNENVIFYLFEDERDNPIMQTTEKDIVNQKVPFVLIRDQFTYIDKLHDLNSRLQTYINKIYSMRPITKFVPFESIGETHGLSVVCDKCSDMIITLNQLFQSILELSDDIGRTIGEIFKSDRLFPIGCYSDTLIDAISSVIYYSVCLENLIPSKKALVDDFSRYLYYVKKRKENQVKEGIDQINDPRSVIYSYKLITGAIADNISHTKDSCIENIFFNHYEPIFSKGYYLEKTQVIIGVVTMFIFCRLHKEGKLHFTDKQINVLAGVFSEFRFITYIYEFCIDIKFADIIKKSVVPKKPDMYVFDELNNKLQKDFKKLSNILPPINRSDFIDSKKSYDLLERTIRDISELITEMNQKVGFLLMGKRPANEKFKTSYEATVDYIFKETKDFNLAHSLLKITKNVGSIRDLITRNLGILSTMVHEHISKYLTSFRNTDMPVLLKNKNASIVKRLSLIEHMLFLYNDSSNVKPVASDPYLIEYARICFQYLINPESDSSRKKFFVSPISDSEKSRIVKFLNETQYYKEMIRLQETLERVSDCSSLYFKEYHLDFDKVTSFRVSMSIPYILCDYAVRNCKLSGLTDSIFYPLIIYNDALAHALGPLKSVDLYEEIKQEASLCTEYVVKDIANLLFDKSVISFISSSFSHSSKSKSRHDVETDMIALRFSPILNQNQLFVLLSFIDTKKMIVKSAVDNFREHITRTLERVNNFGLLAYSVYERDIAVLKTAYQYYAHTGMDLPPFSDVLGSVEGEFVGSSHSMISKTIICKLMESVIPYYYGSVMPMKLCPRRKCTVASIFKQQSDRTSDKRGENDMSSDSITIDAVKKFVVNTNEGIIKILFDTLGQVLLEQIEVFRSSYSNNIDKLALINFLPLSSLSSQVYDRYCSAYSCFLDDESVRACIGSLQQIGNIFILSQMLDQALLMNEVVTQQASVFLFDESDSNLFSSTFPYFQEYGKAFRAGLDRSSNKDVVLYPTFSTRMLSYICDFIRGNQEIFAEPSKDLLKPHTFRGFASRWSVLEFLIASTRINRDNYAQSLPLDSFYVLPCIILKLTKQESIYKSVSINERIYLHSELQIVQSMNNNIKDLINIHKRNIISYKSIMSDVSPIIDTYIQNQ